jgi:hypothetical protein
MFNRKSSPAEAPAVTVQDGAIAEAWGYSIWAWTALTDAERADLRNRIMYAPNRAAVFTS